MLTSLPAINSAIASTTRTRSSIESRGQRYGPSPFNARSPSASFSCGSGRPEIADRPTMRGPCGLICAGSSGRTHLGGLIGQAHSAGPARDAASALLFGVTALASGRATHQLTSSPQATEPAPQADGL